MERTGSVQVSSSWMIASCILFYRVIAIISFLSEIGERIGFVLVSSSWMIASCIMFSRNIAIISFLSEIGRYGPKSSKRSEFLMTFAMDKALIEGGEQGGLSGSIDTGYHVGDQDHPSSFSAFISITKICYVI